MCRGRRRERDRRRGSEPGGRGAAVGHRDDQRHPAGEADTASSADVPVRPPSNTRMSVTASPQPPPSNMRLFPKGSFLSAGPKAVSSLRHCPSTAFPLPSHRLSLNVCRRPAGATTRTARRSWRSRTGRQSPCRVSAVGTRFSNQRSEIFSAFLGSNPRTSVFHGVVSALGFSRLSFLNQRSEIRYVHSFLKRENRDYLCLQIWRFHTAQQCLPHRTATFP